MPPCCSDFYPSDLHLDEDTCYSEGPVKIKAPEEASDRLPGKKAVCREGFSHTFHLLLDPKPCFCLCHSLCIEEVVLHGTAVFSGARFFSADGKMWSCSQCPRNLFCSGGSVLQ